MLLARRACLEDVGLFDERYFAYCEEADLALRARARGWRCGMVWDAVVQNTGIGSLEVSEYLRSRNTLHLVRRWSGRYKALIRLALALPPAAQTRPHRLGVRDFLANRWGPPPLDLLR
jgi:GT2 family glycosyltransferase